jgi:hypothetical protein
MHRCLLSFPRVFSSSTLATTCCILWNTWFAEFLSPHENLSSVKEGFSSQQLPGT